MSEKNNSDSPLEKCLQLIEQKVGWGSGTQWTTQDFKALSEKIYNVTGTKLSIATLKRLWGTVSYQSKPTVTTLNALVQFLGYENWRVFEQSFPQNQRTKNSLKVGTWETHTKSGLPLRVIFITSSLLMAGAILFYLLINKNDLKQEEAKLATDTLWSFSSKKIVDEGVPNSVLFEYDASAANSEDKVFIQQSWDPKLRQEVKREETSHNSIYYYPGYFLAKLVINDRIVKEHPLYIKTTGWLALIERENVPVYIEATKALTKGSLQLDAAIFRESNVPLQPEVPWISFFNSRQFGNLRSDNFIFETALKSLYNEGSGICQRTEIHILVQGGAIVIPLSIPGCVSDLAIYDRKGKIDDPSRLGVDFSDWVRIKYQVINSWGQLYINEQLAYDSLDLQFPPVDLVGLRFRFQGGGSVDQVKLKSTDGTVVFQDNF